MVIRTGDLSLTKLVMFLILKPWSSLGFLKSSGSVFLCLSMYACKEGLLRCGMSCRLLDGLITSDLMRYGRLGLRIGFGLVPLGPDLSDPKY